MSSVAQKLCEEICEEPETSIKQSKRNVAQEKKICDSPFSSRGKYRGQPTTSIVIEKRREINKLIPKNSNKNRTVVNKFKSKETILDKRFVDTALNTTITGPLRCDTDCITNVRTRDNKLSCRCATKQHRNTCAKEIQTLDFKYYPAFDKACAHRIETVNCGTQLLENWSSKNKATIEKNEIGLASVDIQTCMRRRDDNNVVAEWRNAKERKFKSNRWALSRWPTRGPDF